jgi:hypothetical protein
MVLSGKDAGGGQTAVREADVKHGAEDGMEVKPVS